MSRTPWSVTAPLPARPSLLADVRADVCVVGAGVAGLSTARELALDGRAVVVLDGDAVESETARTTAHLVTALDRGWASLIWLHGEALARLAAQSHAAAIDRIEATVRAEGISCDFARVDGHLFAASADSAGSLEEERDAARRAGVEAQLLPCAPFPEIETGPVLRFPRQAQLHPLRYLAGLREVAERAGVRVFGGTHVTAVEAGRPARVATAAGPSVLADAVVVATNTPITGAVALHTKQAAYRTYAIGVRAPHGALPAALFWDTAQPFHYVRVQPHGAADLVLVGGEDHKTGQNGDPPSARWDRLEGWARAHVRRLGPVEHRWSGQVMESMDGLAFIGRCGADSPLFVVTGDSGDGMTHGTIAGMLLADLVAGRESAWAAVYDPSRIRLRAVGEFARENLNVATQYASWLAPGEGGAVPRGSGRIVRRGLGRVAVHRDGEGHVVERSAVCPHLGCIVAWNSEEGTWDCPCHGSRFDASGRVLHGPATRGLAPAADEEAGHEPAAPV